VFDHINEFLVTVTVVLAVAAVALRFLLSVNRVEWIKRAMTWLLEYVDVGLSALVIALVIRSFVIEPFEIPSSSMEDTLLVGDHLFVNRFIYGLKIPYMDARPLALRTPHRGDIIVFVPPHQRDTDFIKRVIGTPGDTVEIRINTKIMHGLKYAEVASQAVYVNNIKLTEPYVVHKDVLPWRVYEQVKDDLPKRTLPPGKYFMMGDNRDQSADSRYWGYAAMADIKGKAMIIYLSWDRNVPFYDVFHKLLSIRWSRIFHLVS
jgi:signal peptidase I